MYNRDHARFEAADIDKDGELSLGEFVLFKNPLRDENVKAVVLERALTPVDTDKDGRISLSEFLEDWHQRVSRRVECQTFHIGWTQTLFRDYWKFS